MSRYEFSQESKIRIINFLREYIDLCLRHRVVVLGIIRAETAMFEVRRHGSYDIKDEVRRLVREMIRNEYDDSGNIEINREDVTYLYNSVKDLLE